LDGAWYYIGIQKFVEFINVLKSDLDEIDKIIIEMNGLAENLIKILDNMSRRLKKRIPSSTIAGCIENKIFYIDHDI
jgi:c-di-GMP-related signal transduction protein